MQGVVNYHCSRRNGVDRNQTSSLRRTGKGSLEEKTLGVFRAKSEGASSRTSLYYVAGQMHRESVNRVLQSLFHEVNYEVALRGRLRSDHGIRSRVKLVTSK